MKCNKTMKLFSRYVDGELSSRDRESVERHVAACAGCRQEFEALKADADLLRAFPGPGPSDWLVTRTMAEVRQEGLRQTTRRPAWARVLATAAAVVLVAAGAWFGTVLGTEFVRNGDSQDELYGEQVVPFAEFAEAQFGEE
jgi:anti-sigma factor RsiW